ncbi:dihydroxyacetone kinase phosphoryl donor subunit DhaM [Fonticella tunisiensis]|uniref:phosphoenolpyruvate--glycerone phosphotransferase n=1 Tax=Fonticella tunisiensis TaxID=1096341 RepID=A0A4R7KAC6_9CLOT|nr:dihydroxyacetone kinase phosphoryl donor subunit DhaM [Fonticella tunisiensis]TDT50344.1 dihydroxyacetone kinase DhaM subunit [Fonticella tunisiensis]
MIAVIIVSHSEKVAEGVKDIAEQMNNSKIMIRAAGGTENGRIGTNTLKIYETFEEVKNADNILVFVDLGSSIMATEMAMDMLDDEIREKITIVDAPIVEGALGAVIQATVTDNVKNIIETAIESKSLSKLQE